jgi:hypothetical protein
MIKTGIHHISQLAGSARLKSLFGRNRVISVTLYDQILDLPNADALAERTLDYFSDERGVYKRTYANRFEQFDSQLLRLLTEQFNPQDPLVLADVSVSDGRTACDLFERLAPHFPKIAHYASDYSPRVMVLRQGRTTLVLSRNNRILETVWPPFVFSATTPENPIYYPVNHAIRLLVKRFLAEPLRARYLAGQVKASELQLFSLRALNLLRKDERFHLGEQNILEPLATPEPPHVVRAMNVLNPTYFGPSDLDRILENFHAALRMGGWLVAGSNEDAGSIVHGGIYRKIRTGFEKIWHSGNGLEKEAHILSWKSPAD